MKTMKFYQDLLEKKKSSSVAKIKGVQIGGI